MNTPFSINECVARRHGILFHSRDTPKRRGRRGLKEQNCQDLVPVQRSHLGCDLLHADLRGGSAGFSGTASLSTDIESEIREYYL
jgi:hypothetical protein